jgi:alpha-tubulin suppressor-like RCC1 family protein
MGCHRHNEDDWSDYARFSFLQAGSLARYLPNAPTSSSAAMPQSELTFDTLKSDPAAARAVATWLGATACGGGCQPPPHGVATCDTGQCVVSCQVGFDACAFGCCQTQAGGDDATISAGSAHACALTFERDVACWGENVRGATAPPGGSFAAVAAGQRHSCGIRTDGTVACWGSDEFDRAKPPPGTFRAISAGTNHTCGVQTDGTLACWGLATGGLTTPPPGIFRSVSAGAAISCGIRRDQTIQCWGQTTTPPTGTFSAVSVSRLQAGGCAIRTDDSVACWGAGSFLAGVPTTSFKSISVGFDHACGVRSDDWVACWGSNDFLQSNPRAGTFTAVTAGDEFTCGTTTDHEAVCWGNAANGETSPPNESFF